MRVIFINLLLCWVLCLMAVVSVQAAENIAVVAESKDQSSEVEDLKEMVKMLSQRVTALEGQLAKENSPQPTQATVASTSTVMTSCQEARARAKADRVLVKSGNDRVKLTVSGQVNRGVLFADNGDTSRFFHVDNDNSSTRFKLLGVAKVTDDFKIGSNIVIQLEQNSTSNIDIVKSDAKDVITDRQLEVYFDHKKYGRLWIGKGLTASDTTSQNDLSGTPVIANAARGQVFAGGLSFVDARDPKAMGPRVKQVYDDFDGLSRQNRIRYDTPRYYGFMLGASHVNFGGSDDTQSYDVALKFAGEKNGVKLQAAAAAAHVHQKFNQYNGSLSVLFNGVSAGVTLGSANFKNEARLTRKQANMAGGKLGYQHDWFGIGKTAVAIDYAECYNLDQAKDRAKLYGAFLVQNIEAAATEVYLGWRGHHLARSDKDYQTINAVMAGARVKF